MILDALSDLGNFVMFLVSAVFYLLTPPYKPRLAIRQTRIIGAESFFLIALIGAFTGMVLGLQGYNTLFPWAWHWTGQTIVGLSYRLKQGDPGVRRPIFEPSS